MGTQEKQYQNSHGALAEHSITGCDGFLVSFRSLLQQGKQQSSGQGEGRTRKSLGERVAWTWGIPALGTVVWGELACNRRLWKA